MSTLATSDLDTGFIVDMISWLEDNTDFDVDAYHDKYAEEQIATAKARELAPNIYAYSHNLAETTLFDEFCKLNLNPADVGSSRFNQIGLNRMFKTVLVENPTFYPLKNEYTRKSLRGLPKITIVGAQGADAEIPTACINNQAEILVNHTFCQNLIMWAHLRGIKPKGSKYKSNGGKIPDDWVYIEFILAHELMHYTSGDFEYGSVYNVSSAVINYAGDFRTNWKLISLGMDQLPIGLYSSVLNLDVQKSYYDIVRIVDEEIRALQQENLSLPKDQDWDSHVDGEDELRESTVDGDPSSTSEGGDSNTGKGKPQYKPQQGDEDESQDGDEGDDSSKGKGKPQSKPQQGDEDESQDDDSGKGKGKAKPQQGDEDESQDGDEGDDSSKGKGKPKGKAKGSGDGEDKPIPKPLLVDEDDGEKVEEISTKVDREVEEQQEVNQEETLDKQLDDMAGKSRSGARSSRLDISGMGAKQYGGERDLDPVYSWERLLKGAIANAQGGEESTYSKLHRSSITRIHQAVNTGMAAIKPGSKTTDEFKLCLVVDASGSMYFNLAQIYTEIRKLFKLSGISKQIRGYQFSSTYKSFMLDVKGKKASRLNRSGKVVSTHPIEAFFSADLEETQLSAALVNELQELSKDGYVIVIISDSDLVSDGANLAALKRLLSKARRNTFVICDSPKTSRYLVEYANMSKRHVSNFVIQ